VLLSNKIPCRELRILSGAIFYCIGISYAIKKTAATPKRHYRNLTKAIKIAFRY